MAFYRVIIIFVAFLMVRTFGRPIITSTENDALIEQLITNAISNENGEADEKSTNSSLKIVGGYSAPPHSAPWIVSLQMYTGLPKRWFHMCGGAILSTEWILTAGHCLHGMNSQTIEIVAGAHNLAVNESSTQQRRAIQKAIVYPKYKGGVAPYDIALVQLTQPLEYTSSVEKIQLPSDTNQLPRGWATLYGWGSTSNTSTPKLPKTLQMMTVQIISSNQCKTIFNAEQFQLISNELTICTGPIEGTPSACNGDSGSALSQGNNVIGVVSWGVSPCGGANSASVYTRVSTYTDWIRSTIMASIVWNNIE